MGCQVGIKGSGVFLSIMGHSRMVYQEAVELLSHKSTMTDKTRSPKDSREEPQHAIGP